MILEGNQRGGARDLAVHLMKPENEHIEVHEIRGFVGDTIKDALREAEAISRGSRCRQFLYSLSLNPPETASVSVAVFEDAIARAEERLGVTERPRIVVFHEKNGRRHAHCVWSRIDAETMTAVRMSHDRRKLGDVSRELFLLHGWKMPRGLIDRELRNPLNFDQQEWFQAQRVGRDPRDIKKAFQQCWAASDTGQAFRAALEERGYWLARGDRRAIVAIDVNGKVFAVARWVGQKTKEVVQRMGDIQELPALANAQQHVAEQVRAKLSGFIDNITEEFARAAQTLEGQRLEMAERHRKARAALREEQTRRGADEARSRADRFRRGLLGLWDRITGQQHAVRMQNEIEAAAASARDAQQRQSLIELQLRERLALQQEIRQERARCLRATTRLYRSITHRETPMETGMTRQRGRLRNGPRP